MYKSAQVPRFHSRVFLMNKSKIIIVLKNRLLKYLWGFLIKNKSTSESQLKIFTQSSTDISEKRYA